MSQGAGDLRKSGRLELHIPVRVRCKETDGTEWAELTHLIDVTQLGASFTLEHPIATGRILHLSLPLPWRLRQYDHSDELYRIYALVRWIRPSEDGRKAIGVAFVGKNPPASYLHDPSRIYASGRTKDSDKRREGRIQAALMVQLDLIGSDGEIVKSEVTVTENISRHGASCYTTLHPTPGSVLRITSQQTSFSTTAIVRKIRKGKDNIPRVHLEFVGDGWPLDIDEEDAY
jgi:hypothetical protein